MNNVYSVGFLLFWITKHAQADPRTSFLHLGDNHNRRVKNVWFSLQDTPEAHLPLSCWVFFKLNTFLDRQTFWSAFYK